MKHPKSASENNKAEFQNSEIIDFTATLAISETGLGSILHAFNIPLAGHFLSLLQAMILTLAQKKIQLENPEESVLQTSSKVLRISFYGSLLKSLSPMGKRLTPMLAILTQGLLFSLGLIMGGGIFNGLLGCLLGSIFLSSWAFLQPLLISYLIFGDTFFTSVILVWTKIADQLHFNPSLGIYALVLLIMSKIFLSVAIVFLVYRKEGLSQKFLNNLKYRRLQKPVRSNNQLPAWRALLKDIFAPWMLFSFTISGLYFYLNDGFLGFNFAIYLARTLGIAILVLSMIRYFPNPWLKKIQMRFPLLKEIAAKI